jgi:tetratricopeptide (TPR) repeat protein
MIRFSFIAQMQKKTVKNRRRSSSGKRKNAKKTPAHIRKGKIVESVVAMLHDIPGVTVETNVELPPKHGDPERRREIDVLLTGRLAGYEVRIPFSCKNEAGPIKPALIGEFIDTLDDVGIPTEHGIFVCVNGYTKGALDRAKVKGIRTLVLRGLTKDRLASEISEALQFAVYLLAEVNSITVTNTVNTTKHGAEFLVFADKDQQLCGSVLDLIFDRWQKGEPPSRLQEYEIDLDVPKGWYQFVAGNAVEVLGVRCTIKITGLVIEISGEARKHSLVDPVSNVTERSKIAVSFGPLKGQSLPVTAFSSEADLSAFLHRKSAVRVVSRIRLPRIRCGNVYYPFSERVARQMLASLNDPQADQLTFAGIEGTDLSVAFEKPWYGFLRLGPPVFANDETGEIVDVRMLMEAEDYAKVVSLETEFQRNPTPEFAHLLAWAHFSQAQQLILKAESFEKKKKDRQLGLAVEKIQLALHFNPSFSEAYKTLGRVLRDLQRLKESVAAYDAAIAVNNEDFEAWADRAAPLINQDEFSQAIDSASKALENSTDSSSRSYSLATRAAAHHFAGHPRDAVEDLVAAWQLEPSIIVESFQAHNIYDPICVTEPSLQSVLLLSEMRWAKAAYFASKGNLDEAGRWAKTAGDTLGLLTSAEKEESVIVGTLSNEVIDGVLQRIVSRLRNAGSEDFTANSVRLIQDWVVGIRGKELDTLNKFIGTTKLSE